MRRLLRMLLQAGADEPTPAAAGPGPKDGPGPKSGPGPAAGPGDGPGPKSGPGSMEGPGPKSGPAPGPKDGPGPKSGPGPAAKPTPADEPTAEPDAEPAATEPKADVTEETPTSPADTPATVSEDTETPSSNATEKTVSLDAAATVEELPGGPKAMIEVLTSIQPLTKEESDSVLGTTGSEYFKQTFRKTLAATNLTLVDDLVVKVAEPQKEFKWPVAPPGKKKTNESEYN